MVRKLVQFVTLILQNSYLNGFLTGSLYRGKLKQLCVPGLNCYSCPGALGACPVGSLQALATNPKIIISLYIYGFITLVGVTVGRFICGFLCPFGLVQELLHKIPTKKIQAQKWFKWFEKLKYIVLILFVVAIPTIFTIRGGIGFPAFCQWICPAGTLEAGIPLVLLNNRISKAVGFLFWWKVGILLIIVIFSVMMFRPFCRFLCPLGAMYSLFNRISVICIYIDEALCTNCNNCRNTCLVDAENTDASECIRCGECTTKCPAKAKRWGVRKNSSMRTSCKKE